MDIIVRMRGGLGNQMFQFAFAYALKKQYSCVDKIFLDTRGFKHYYRAFDLDDFLLDGECEILKKGPLRYDVSFRLFNLTRGILKRVFKKNIADAPKFLARKGMIYSDRVCSIPPQIRKKSIYLFGYFQDADILNPYRVELSKMFSLKGKASAKLEKYLSLIKNNNVVVSVRISENNKLEGLKYTEKEYYFHALNELFKIKKIEQIIIMSNRLNIVKDEDWFSKYGIECLYIDGCSPAEQMEIMKRCENYIISNSTFSWWGAYLGNVDHNGVILAPEDWYTSDKLEETKMMFDEISILKNE